MFNAFILNTGFAAGNCQKTVPAKCQNELFNANDLARLKFPLLAIWNGSNDFVKVFAHGDGFSDTPLLMMQAD